MKLTVAAQAPMVVHALSAQLSASKLRFAGPTSHGDRTSVVIDLPPGSGIEGDVPLLGRIKLGCGLDGAVELTVSPTVAALARARLPVRSQRFEGSVIQGLQVVFTLDMREGLETEIPLPAIGSIWCTVAA